MSDSVPSVTSLPSNDDGAVTLIVPLYMSILNTVQPSGVDVAVIEVILWLSKSVVPVSPGMLTKILFDGTARLYTSSLLHATIAQPRISDVIRSVVNRFIYLFTLFLIYYVS